MFTTALFTTAKTWKQRKCPSTDEWIKKMWYIYKMGYSGHKKIKFAICRNTDGLGGHYAKLNKLDKDNYYMISPIGGV